MTHLACELMLLLDNVITSVLHTILKIYGSVTLDVNKMQK